MKKIYPYSNLLALRFFKKVEKQYYNWDLVGKIKQV